MSSDPGTGISTQFQWKRIGHLTFVTLLDKRDYLSTQHYSQKQIKQKSLILKILQLLKEFKEK